MKDEILKEIEHFGKLAFTPEQVAVIVELDVVEFKKQIENKSGDMYKAYFRGVLLRESELRTTVFDQALSGSTPAQAVAIGYFEKLRLELLG